MYPLAEDGLNATTPSLLDLDDGLAVACGCRRAASRLAERLQSSRGRGRVCWGNPRAYLPHTATHEYFRLCLHNPRCRIADAPYAVRSRRDRAQEGLVE